MGTGHLRKRGTLTIRDFLIDDLPQIVLICAGLYIVARSTGASFLSQCEGTVMAIFSPSQCARDRGSSSLQIEVRLRDGSIEKAEMSPCTACLEKIKKGDVVNLTRSGRRLLAQKGVSWCR